MNTTTGVPPPAVTQQVVFGVSSGRVAPPAALRLTDRANTPSSRWIRRHSRRGDHADGIRRRRGRQAGEIQQRDEVIRGGRRGEIRSYNRAAAAGSVRSCALVASSKRCAQSNAPSDCDQFIARRLWTTLPLPRIEDAASRRAASLAPVTVGVVQRLVGVDRQLHHRDRRVGEGVHQNRPFRGRSLSCPGRRPPRWARPESR